jgi:hypothetical protein
MTRTAACRRCLPQYMKCSQTCCRNVMERARRAGGSDAMRHGAHALAAAL